ncbi:sensor histidine kinase [Sporosarcina sp. USHLN248]|uniref:sensor histidine kinase n=1 Tax=Sporosarcina sp. USHLN248 TaxID=3081300 RepID=UPI003015CA5A
MKNTYFIWLTIHCIVWASAIISMSESLNEIRILGICLFFTVLFLLPVFRYRPMLQTFLFCIQALTAVIIFFPINNQLNPFVFLVQMLMIGEAVFYLSRMKSLAVISVQVGCIAWIMVNVDTNKTFVVWCILFYLLLIIGMLHYQVVCHREREVGNRNAALLDEYRKMKRLLMTEEERARQDERMLIGHEIHDSVGHKLTSLLMQFEAFRLTAADQDKEKINRLKILAEQSLDETRRAVKSFKQKEVGGLIGVIRLIRKLELESYMKINFSVKHGAFAAPLTGEQSFVIYRAVQEALTNIMKHSSAKEAQVMFECPGGSVFRFEVVNITDPNPLFQEGYGLKAMRERLEKAGGLLEIQHDGRHFIVRGHIGLKERGE